MSVMNGSTMQPLLLAVGFLLLGCIAFTNGQDYHYDCNRHGQQCQNSGTCNITMGDCDCPPDTTGFRCQVNTTANYNNCTSGLECENGGTCYNDGTADRCLCPADFVGNNCETPRVDFFCSGDNIQITFSPIRPFENGIVYVGSDSDDGSCALMENSELNYVATLPLNTSCGAYIEEDTSTNETTYFWTLNIEYITFIDDSYPFSVNVSCVHSANNSRESSSGANPQPARPFTAPPVTQDYQPAVLELRKYPDFQSNAGQNVVIRQPVYLFNYLADTSVFKRLRVEQCSVSDGTRSVSIITDGCAITLLESIFFVNNDATTSPVGVRHGFKVFRLKKSTRSLTFTCQVKMCRSDTDTECDLQNCNPLSNAARRRRRDVASRNRVGVTVIDEEEQISSLTVQIKEPEEGEEGFIADDGLVNAENCSEEPVIRTTLIAMGVVSCLLLVIVVVLITCLIRHHTSGGSDKSSQMEDVLTDNSSWFRIPRVKTT